MMARAFRFKAIQQYSCSLRQAPYIGTCPSPNGILSSRRSYELQIFLIPHQQLSPRSTFQDESQVEKEASSSPQAQEKKDASPIQINTSHITSTMTPPSR
ncbi:hypothetical protein HYQ44_016295 [Verticillium longisporum]|nr:hypothetical protein HYQ44_016295 [Verticillium longisporum]